MVSRERAGTRSAHLYVTFSLGDVKHRADGRLFVLAGMVVTREDESCTLGCGGGSSHAREPNARDDQALRYALEQSPTVSVGPVQYIETRRKGLGLTKINGRMVKAME
jgi:hypothetical protein